MVEVDHFGLSFQDYKKGDLHTHTSYSFDTYRSDGALHPYQLVEKAVEEELDFVAVTDHDTVASSYLAKEHALVEGYPIEVITGAEVSSNDGHILALGIETNIPFWMSAKDTIRAIHEQGGLAVAAHPFYTLTHSVGEEVLKKIAADEEEDIYWDAIEVFNGGANDWRFVERTKRLGRKDGNRRARDFYARESVTDDFGAAVAGSDAHNLGVGRTLTIIPDTMDIFSAIKRRETGVVMMNGKEAYTPGSLLETKRRSNDLEKERRALPVDGRIFPLREASSQIA